MQITRQADYALRAVLYLARSDPQTRVATAEIAREEHIPATFLAKIVSQLSAIGVLQAMRGARGGVRLAKPPNEITLLEIVEAIDGPITLNECVTNTEACSMTESCPLRPVWCDAHALLVDKLRQTTFDQLSLAGQPAEIPLTT